MSQHGRVWKWWYSGNLLTCGENKTQNMFVGKRHTTVKISGTPILGSKQLTCKHVLQQNCWDFFSHLAIAICFRAWRCGQGSLFWDLPGALFGSKKVWVWWTTNIINKVGMVEPTEVEQCLENTKRLGNPSKKIGVDRSLPIGIPKVLIF